MPLRTFISFSSWARVPGGSNELIGTAACSRSGSWFVGTDDSLGFDAYDFNGICLKEEICADMVCVCDDSIESYGVVDSFGIAGSFCGVLRRCDVLRTRTCYWSRLLSMLVLETRLS